MARSHSSHIEKTSQAWFATTRWSVVLTAQDKQSSRCHQAMDGLCRTYWYPLYAFVRRQGCTADEAADFTQGFFARCLEKDWLDNVDQNKGRFRSFLLAAMKHYMSNERARQRAKKRGGGKRIFSLDTTTAETRYKIEPEVTTTPEQLFERQWALALLDTVLKDLEDQYQKEGKGEMFDSLKPCLIGQTASLPYDELALKLQCTEGAARVLVHRLKKRYRDLLRQHIAHTVATPEDVDAEMQYLRAILSGS
ncbi:MAG: sigma-70 family RNA polymerase sigma factor [Planctomycetes bacterium]|nr:sigma-70 family RNA polymerase sigma factor [Planctomycetota bacterium]